MQEKRVDVLRQFYTQLDRDTAEQLLADDFKMQEEGHDKVFSKKDYIGLLYGAVKPAVPDFTWGYASSGDIDIDGFMLVTVQVGIHGMYGHNVKIQEHT